MEEYRKYEEFPKIVHVETTNVCNLKCIHCPQANLSLIPNYKPEYIKYELYEKICLEVGKNHGILRLTPDGEPLIHPDWNKQVNCALTSGVDVFCFNTNGILMDNEKIDTLLQETDTKIAIEFSIDALYPMSYNNIRVGGNYRQLLSNIFRMLDEREKRRKKNIKILVSCIKQPELGKDEFKSFVKFWSSLVDKVITRNYVDTKGLTPKKLEVQNIPEERWPCPVVFTRLVVGIDGTVRFCPDDWLKNTVIADIKEKSLCDIWKSEFMKKLRKSHIEGIFDNSNCEKCTDWSVIRWGNDYIKALDDLFE